MNKPSIFAIIVGSLIIIWIILAGNYSMETLSERHQIISEISGYFIKGKCPNDPKAIAILSNRLDQKALDALLFREPADMKILSAYLWKCRRGK